MQEKTDNIALIIIDQLRADYFRLFKECSRLLPYKAVVDTNSMPTSTEAMHANMSTGEYPATHGFISKETREGERGLQQIVGKIESKEIPSFALMGAECGFDVCVIGGKEETVRVMGSPEQCSLMLYYDKDDKIFIFTGNDNSLIARAKQSSPSNFDFNSQKMILDSILLDIFDEARIMESRSFNILTLPSLDYIGHRFGPNSPETEEHLKYLDKRIFGIITQSPDNALLIIVGDHGCRKTDRYLIQSDERDFRDIAVYHRKDEGFAFKNRYYLDNERNFERVSYDGGIMRIWLKKDAGSISQEEVSFLSDYGKLYNMHQLDLIPDQEVRNLLKNSRHENLGDLIVDGLPDTTFCKFSWIKGAANKIKKCVDLADHELPCGEHGTSHAEDREVFCISNYDLGDDRMPNIQLNKYIRETMKSVR